MAASINSLLERLAAQYYIPAQSNEAKKIDKSVANIKDNLKSYFGKNLITPTTYLEPTKFCKNIMAAQL